MMRWGLIPFGSKDTPGFSTINAKCETIATSAVYREAFRRRRCLVPASGFYEWKKLDTKHKQPYAIRVKDASLCAFAGVWHRWKDKTTQQTLETYSIITTGPNELTAVVMWNWPDVKLVCEVWCSCLAVPPSENTTLKLDSG